MGHFCTHWCEEPLPLRSIGGDMTYPHFLCACMRRMRVPGVAGTTFHTWTMSN